MAGPRQFTQKLLVNKIVSSSLIIICCIANSRNYDFSCAGAATLEEATVFAYWH